MLRFCIWTFELLFRLSPNYYFAFTNLLKNAAVVIPSIYFIGDTGKCQSSDYKSSMFTVRRPVPIKNEIILIITTNIICRPCFLRSKKNCLIVTMSLIKLWSFIVKLYYSMTFYFWTGQIDNLFRRSRGEKFFEHCESSDDPDDESGGVKTIGFENIFTAFILLLIGIAFGSIVAICERLKHMRNPKARKRRQERKARLVYF